MATPDDDSAEAASSSASAAAPSDAGGGGATGARRSVASWASKLGQKASQLKSVTKEAVQSTKEAIANEAKLVARDMADLKDGVREGVRLTVQDTNSLRERLGRDTDALRKAFAPPKREASAQDAGEAPAEERQEAASSSEGPAAPAGHEDKKNLTDTTRNLLGKVGGFFQLPEDGSDRQHQLKEKVEDIKAGGKKAAEKVLDVGGKLWQKTDHWLHNLRGGPGSEAAPVVEVEGWDECHQRALALQCSYLEGPGLADWVLQSLSKGMLEDYAKTAVVFHTAVDDMDKIQRMVKQREPCNASMQRQYDASVLEAKLGYQFGAYAQSTKTELMPNIAVYCKTPLHVGGVSVDVHVLNSTPFAFGDTSEPDYQYFFPLDEVKWAELVLRTKRVWSTCFECARYLGVKKIFLPDLGGGAAAKLLVAPRDYGRLKEESLSPVRAIYKEVDVKPMPDISWIFSEDGKAELADSLFVHEWNPWSLVGNGGVESEGATCDLGNASALSVLCWPATNPHLRFQALTYPFEAHEQQKVPPPPPPAAAPVQAADLLDMAASSSAAPANPAAEEPMQPQQQQQQPEAADMFSIEDDDLLDLQDDHPKSAPNGASHPAPAEDPDNWLDELESDFVADGTGEPSPTAAQTAAALDADFDDLWDSMMDDTSKPAA